MTTQETKPEVPKGMRAWLLALRSYSLTASVMPVLLAVGLARAFELDYPTWLAAPVLATALLLHIGTNGINSGGGTSSADVAAILDMIQAWETANSSPVTVMLARIIGSPDATTNANVTTFNNNIAAMAQTRINNGDKIVIVNQQTGALLNYQLGAADGSPSGPDMVDNLHPNQDGYDKMADKWKADLISSGTLPSCP